MQYIDRADQNVVTHADEGEAFVPLSGVRTLAAFHSRARIAVVHDWCPNFRGGERVLSRICSLFPQAEVFTLFDFLPIEIKDKYFSSKKFHTSIANSLPFVEKYYRSLFFAAPFLIEQFDVTGYDAVISSSAAFARGVITRPDQPHLCYVHSPIRYAWDEQFTYLQQSGLGFGPKGLAFRYLLHNLRSWDVRTAHNPDVMLANSNYVRARIQRIYGRESLVVHPPIATGELEYSAIKDDYYVTAAFHAPYKRSDVVVEAFSKMPSRKLIVVGDYAQSRHLRSIATPNVEFTGYLPRDEYVSKVSHARAMVFAGCEDFGIALAEAQFCGTPLIAFGRGGASDITRPLGLAKLPTGVLFNRQTAASVEEAVEFFEANESAITPQACHANAQRFSEDRFDRAIVRALGVAEAIRVSPANGRDAYTDPDGLHDEVGPANSSVQLNGFARPTVSLR